MPDGLLEAYINELPAIEQFAAQRGPVSLQDVPVRLTVFQGPGGWMGNQQANFNTALNNLNAAFQSAGLHFVPCGPINEIWDDRIKDPNNDPDTFLPLFAFTSGAMEVYLRASPFPNTAAIPLPAYQSGNPNYPYSYQNENWVNMTSPSDLTNSAFVHEVGHHFGLLHTHNVSASYDVPAYNENTKDYPYPVYVPNTTPPQIQPWWWGRELVIRGDVPQGTKTFNLKNSNIAGDLIEDTPADCGADITNYFPGCPLTAQDPLTCQFNSTLTYEDYNGDKIFPPPTGYSLGRNYMSYWRYCRIEFTPLQNIRSAYYYETIYKPEYVLNKCGNFADRVELEGGSLGLQNVTIRVRHPLDARKCNVTTDKEGDFDGILHTDNLQAYVYHNGQKNTLAYPGDPLRIHYDHTNCEWLRGIKTSDLLLITKHILGITPFTTGYQKIAADANKSNSVTTFDIVEIRKLILGIYEKLPAHDQPWRYVPEFIPQDYSSDFNYNPFSIAIGGGAAYLDQGWQFTLTDLNNGKKGFDGIKIGDVNTSWPNEPDCPNESVISSDEGEKPVFTVPSSSLTQNQVVALTFKANSFQQVEAFQLGIQLPYDYFELLDVTNTTLPSYTESDNFGMTKLEENKVRTLWFAENGGSQSLQNNSTLFSLVVRAKQPIADLQSVLKLDNSILPNEFWRAGTVTAEPVSLTISVEQVEERTDSQTPKNSLQTSDESLRCTPNPFTNNIQLTFLHQGQAAQGALQITNAHGIEIHRQEILVSGGENTLEINALKGAPTGIYWISLNVNGKTSTRKLVKE